MFSFTKTPETKLSFLGREYRLDLSFNVVIEAFGVTDNQDLSDEEKVDKCFNLLVKDDFAYDDLSIKAEVISSLFGYLGKRPYGYDDDSDEDNTIKPIPNIDFEQDAGAIYASFLDQYGIDLNQQLNRMHWDTFIALFDNLSGDTAINQIISYRQDDLTDYEDDAKGLARASELKEHYKLDKVRKLEEDETRDKFSGNAQSIFSSMFNSH